MGDCAGSSCDATCQSGCYGCTGSCEGCSGYCENGCGGCGDNCDGCGGCGGCDGGCSNTCKTACLSTCKTACNTACTATNTAAIIAALGAGIVKGQYIRPADFINVKNAIINEFRRRGNTTYVNNYSVVPTVGGKYLDEHGQKILNDVYAFDNSKDWRSGHVLGSSASLRPAIEHIKALMNTIVPLP